MTNLRNGSQEGSEPGLTSLRVRHSTAELPRSNLIVLTESSFCQGSARACSMWMDACPT